MAPSTSAPWTPRCSGPEQNSCNPQARSSTDGASTKPWPCGRPTPRWQPSPTALAAFATAWQKADKVVYSTTLTAASTANTRIEGHFDPTAVHELKATADSDITVGGANLAAQAFKAGLVDECQL